MAHGVPFKEGDETNYGLALHDDHEPTKADVVSGNRLATLLRPQIERRGGELACPSVVTIASCDSGNVGSVVGAGASVAHALHESGIPLVVSFQFPLSCSGSVVLTQSLYEGRLAGSDPRRLVDKTRRLLKTQVSKSHDWAGLVAYASLPTDIEQKIAEARILSGGPMTGWKRP